MIIAVLLWIVIFSTIGCVATHYIRRASDRRYIMNNLHTAHGCLGTGHYETETKSVPSYSHVISSNGNYSEVISFHHERMATGFSLCLYPRWVQPGNSSTIYPDYSTTPIKVYSLPKDNINNPVLQLPAGKNVGTLTYGTDKNGKHYFVSFTPDAH